MSADGDSFKRALELIPQLYDAALDPELWAEMSGLISKCFDSTSVALLTQTGATTSWLARTPNIDDRALESYQARFKHLDIWAQRAVELGLGQALSSADVVSDAEFESSAFYNDWARHVDNFHVLGAVVPVTPNDLGVIGIHRPRAASPFETGDKHLLSIVLPHLKSALQLHIRLRNMEIERSASLDALDRSGTAILVVSARLRVIYCSGAAARLLHAGGPLSVRNGRLLAADRQTHDRLTTLIRSAVAAAIGKSAAAGGNIAIPRHDAPPLTALVAPFNAARDGFGSSEPAAILFVRTPGSPPLQPGALRDLFGMTRAEARLACALAAGQPLDAITGHFGVTLNTARSQLKSVFAKTSTNRQSELVALLARSSAMFRP